MKEKHNFKVDSANSAVLIDIPSPIFPTPVVLRAVYHFIDEARVIVGRDKETIVVTLIPNQKADETALEEMAYEFNIQLVSSYVEEAESERHTKLRDDIMRAALLPRTMGNQEKK